MRGDADYRKKELVDKNEIRGPVFKLKDEPRVTTVGKFLRKFSIDKFPQLYGVLRGDMSLVSPRPALQYEYKNFEEWRKLSIKPGMACRREVYSLKNGEKITDFDKWVKLDLDHIDNSPLWLDFKILMRVAFVILLGKNY